MCEQLFAVLFIVDGRISNSITYLRQCKIYPHLGVDSPNETAYTVCMRVCVYVCMRMDARNESGATNSMNVIV